MKNHENVEAKGAERIECPSCRDAGQIWEEMEDDDGYWRECDNLDCEGTGQVSRAAFAASEKRKGGQD